MAEREWDMAGDLENLLVQVGEGTFDGPVAITWGVHEGIRGATWITVFADGRVQIRKQAEPEDELTVYDGQGQEPVRELVSTILTYDIPNLRLPPPQDPSHALTLEVSGGDVSWQLHFSRLALQDTPQLLDLQQTFSRIRNQARDAAAVAERPAADVAPLTVRISTIFKVTAVIGGIMTCGLVGVMLWVVSRSMPKTMDGLGIRLRNRKRYAWADLTLRKRVASHDETLVMGYDLLTEDGRAVRLAEGAFRDGEAVVQYALARMSEV
jgi:hypothetical protein